MMVFCIKNNGENKTRVKRKNKTSKKTNKTNVKTQQNKLEPGLDVFLRGEKKGCFSMAKMSIGLKTPFLKIFQPIGGLQLVSVHIKARCLQLDYFRLLIPSCKNLSVRQILTQRKNGSY